MDVGRYALKEDTKVSYVGHLAGATAGLLLGVLVLCNLRRLDWETKLWWGRALSQYVTHHLLTML